jgi:hypothetical protein
MAAPQIHSSAVCLTRPPATLSIFQENGEGRGEAIPRRKYPGLELHGAISTPRKWGIAQSKIPLKRGIPP